MNSVFLEQFLQISKIETIIFIAILFALFGVLKFLEKKELSFSKRMILGTVLGLILGVILQFASGFSDNPLEITFISEATKWFSLFGNGFIDLIRMLVVPIVMVSIIYVIINMEDKTSVSKITRNTLVVSVSMVAIASILGITLGVIFGLGNTAVTSTQIYEIREVTSLVDTVRSLLPSNPVEAMVETNIIALVIASALFGVSAKKLHKTNSEIIKPFYDLINALHKIIMNIALTIIEFMPFAVVALLANTIASRGVASILEVLLFIGVLYLGLFIMFFVQLFALSIFGLNPINYVKKAVPPLVLAFTSRSSVGTLPLTVETLTDKLGVNSGTASFVAGLGTTAGMQGCAGVFPSLLLVYVANLNNIPIDITFILMTIVVVSLSSFGIAGIPGAAMMSASTSLSGMGFASFFSSISPILAVDPILDMGRTCLNVSGAMTNSIIVDKTLGNLDKNVYNSK